jgi:plastocyanin
VPWGRNVRTVMNFARFARTHSHSHSHARSVFAAGLAAVLMLGLVACGDDDDDDAAPTATTAAGAGGATDTTAAAGGAAATEIIRSLAFTTAEVQVAVGGTVVFDNQDSQPHTATADDGSFDTEQIDAGAQKSIDFATAGTFAFHCEIHPSMKATVVVA